MTTTGIIPGNLPVFDGQGYEDWCVKMEAIFGFQEVEKIVKEGFPELPKNATDDQTYAYRMNKKLDCKARVLLHQCVSMNIFQKISKATTAKQIWDVLKQAYGNVGKTKKVRLQSL